MNIDLGNEHWFHQGGSAMYVLTLFSIVVIAITLEKAIYLSKILKGIDELKDTVKKRDSEKLETLSKYPLFPVFSRLLEILGARKGIDDSLRLINRSIRRFENNVSKGIGWLATIGNTAPFVGLFGTVLGVLKAFTHMGEAEPTAHIGVAAGIAEALINTLAGLIVAIPSVILYNYFLRRINSLMIVVRLDIEDFLEEQMETKDTKSE